MNIFRQLRGFLALWLMAAVLPAQASSTPKSDEAFRENYAYTLGIQAYIFAFPYSYNSDLRWLWVTQPINPERTPYAPLNQFWHHRHLADASYRDGGTPNNDTLYSIAWLDLAKEPLVLSVPEVPERYYVMEMASMDSDNFAYVGSRATGSQAGNYLITGPDWKGEVPAGVTRLPASRTNAALIIGRTLVRDEADRSNVHALQNDYRLTALSQWNGAPVKPADNRDVWRPYDRKADPLNEWRTINRAMTENPPEARLAAWLAQLATIGVGPGQDIDKLDSAMRRGLARAAVDGRQLIKDAAEMGFGRLLLGGWEIQPLHFGRLGLHDQYLTRAAIQSMGGIIANDPEEGTYITAHNDAKGNRLDGSKHRYQIHFAPSELPEVKAFWSLSIYDETTNFVDNPIDRYAIGDRTPGLKKDADGGLTLYLQAEDPGAEKRANWLPIPRSAFYATLRAYLPGEAIVQRRWAPPAIQVVSE